MTKSLYRVLFGLCVFLQLQQVMADDYRFFPARPQLVYLHEATGTLTWYGLGMKSGAVTIQTESGKQIDFYVSDKMKINGSPVRCPDPPHGTFTHPLSCYDWPKNLIIGKTRVTVTYWKSSRYGKPVYVTDQIDY